MLAIKGLVKTGLNKANYTLPLQMKHFAPVFPEIKDCYRASINIELEMPLKILSYDFVTKPIKWDPDYPEEQFGFVRIKLICEHNGGQKQTDAWIYDPFNSRWHSDLFRYEIIAPWVDFDRDKPCYINIDCKHNETPVYCISAF